MASPQSHGSKLSQFKRFVKKAKTKAQNLYHAPISRVNKAKTIGSAIIKTAVKKPLKYAANEKNPFYYKIPAGAAGILGATATTAGVGAALGVGTVTGAVGATTAALGVSTRLAAPVIGAATGFATGLAKGAVEVPFRTTYGIGRALYHLPTAVVRKIKSKMANRRFEKRTGFSNRTLSNIEKLETKQGKAQTALDELTKRQEDKLVKKALSLSPKALEKKQEKYDKQRDLLTKKLTQRTNELENAATKKITKTRFAKDKRGEKQEYKLNTLNTNTRKADESALNYLKRRTNQQFGNKKTAYNNAITKKTKAKQENLTQQISEVDGIIKGKQNEIEALQKQIAKYTTTNTQGKTPTKDRAYFQAIATKAQLQRDISSQTKMRGYVEKKLLTTKAEEQHILRDKSLNVKRQRMERRRARLEKSKDTLAAAGKHIISPLSSVYYGTKTGAQIGNTIGLQAQKYGTFGMVKSGVSNSGQEIKKSGRKFLDLGMGSTKKQDGEKAIKEEEQSTASKFLQKEVNSRKTIKAMDVKKLETTKQTFKGKYNELQNKITALTKMRDSIINPLSTTQKVRIDNLISQLRAKSSKYASALLIVDKKLVG